MAWRRRCQNIPVRSPGIVCLCGGSGVRSFPQVPHWRAKWRHLPWQFSIGSWCSICAPINMQIICLFCRRIRGDECQQMWWNSSPLRYLPCLLLIPQLQYLAIILFLQAFPLKLIDSIPEFVPQFYILYYIWIKTGYRHPPLPQLQHHSPSSSHWVVIPLCHLTNTLAFRNSIDGSPLYNHHFHPPACLLSAFQTRYNFLNNLSWFSI